MASCITSSSLLLLLTILITTSSSQAKEFLVGGSAAGWKVPSSESESLNRWAEATRFQVGDSLVWKFSGENDSVLQVSREDYLACNTSNPIKQHAGGDTAVRLARSGPYYFISGADGACQKGEKVIVVVISERHRQISPAPSPAEFDGPALQPTSGTTTSMKVAISGVLVATMVVIMVPLGW